MTARPPDFSAARAILQAEIDQQRLAGVSAAVLLNGELIEQVCLGQADLQSAEPLRLTTSTAPSATPS